MVLTSVLIATSFPVGAAITHELDAAVLTLLRFALAALAFAPIVAWRYGLAVPGWRDLVRYGVLSAFQVGFFWGMFLALRYTSALNAAVIFVLIPTVTAVASAVLVRERLGRAAWLALAFGGVGAVWVIFRGDPAALAALELGRGDGIFAAAAVSLGIYGALVKYLHRGEPMARMTFWTLVTGMVWLLMLSGPRLAGIAWGAVPATVYGGILYLALFPTLITFFAVQWCIAVIGPTKVQSYMYLNPALVLLVGLPLGQGLPPAATYPGVVLILVATVVVQRSAATYRTPAT